MTTNLALAESTSYGIRRTSDAPPIASRTTVDARALVVRTLSHRYGNGAPAVENVSFEVPAGEVTALLGPSGCGKSTVLRAIAGLIRPQKGSISLGNTDLTVLSARVRGIGMVFQSYALFPHLTIAENIAYPLACRRVGREERRKRVGELLALIQLDGLGKRLPRELSGGQQQRVAVARALASRPSLLLLDEPFGALDRALRFDLQVELLRLQKSLGITTLIVTHDQEEAQSLATQLVVMNRGCIEQIGSPAEIYDRPKTLFVNSFIGQTSQLVGVIESSHVETATIRLSCGALLVLHRPLNFIRGAEVTVTCRPEHVRVLRSAPAAGTDHGLSLAGVIAARLIVSIPLGPTLVHDLELEGGTQIRATETRDAQQTRAPLPGERVFVQIDTERCHVFPRNTND